MGERLAAKRRLAAIRKREPAAQASTKLTPAAISIPMGAGPFMVNEVKPIQRRSEASAAASHSAQRRANAPSTAVRPRSMPSTPMPTPAKK
jgi:hypothetical protein